MFMSRKKPEMPTAATALAARAAPIPTASRHFVNGRPLKGPWPEGLETAMFGMGCFWGAERKFWELGDGIYTTAVGYAGGFTPNPTYREVCSGETGHNEVVLVVYDPKKISYERLLKTFWENHDPTQGMRQGNDVGTQYRSGIYAVTPAQRQVAEASKAMYEKAIKASGHGAITTEILDAPPFYYTAISRQEPVRLLRPRRHRRELPDRPRPRRRRDGVRWLRPAGAKERRDSAFRRLSRKGRIVLA
jgi:peptide-methionine (S)-S-oxide reductase